MAETKTYLKLVFTTELGETHMISLRDPKSGLTSQEVQTAMQNIVTKNIIASNSGDLTGIKEAYIYGTETTQLLP